MKFIILIQLLVFLGQYRDATAHSRYCSVPAIQNGAMEIFAEYISKYTRRELFQKLSIGEQVYHDEKLTIHCDRDYLPSDGETVFENNKVEVTCNNGTWSRIPQCRKSYCSVPDIQNGEMGFTAEYISKYRRAEIFQNISIGEQVYPDEKLTLQCDEGYLPAYGETLIENNKVEVTCNNGTWSRILPCRKDSCEEEPPTIKNGKAMVSSRRHGFTIWYKCDNRKDIKIPGNITCHFGSWTGIPVQCLPTVNEARTTPYVPPLTTTTTMTHVHLTTESSVKELELTSLTSSNPQDTSDCYCIYEGEDFITVKAGNKTLKYGDKVKRGETVSFECVEEFLLWTNGLRVLGPANITCATCEKWKNQNIPACSRFTLGTPFLIFKYPLKLLSKGIAIVEVGMTHFILCGGISRPIWHTPDSSVRYTHQIRDINNPGLPNSILEIWAFGDQVNGKYNCTDERGGRNLQTTLEIQVRSRGCSIGDLYDALPDGVIPEMDGVTEEYVSTGFKIQLICEDNLYFIGNSTVKCENNGKWRVDKFQCVPGCILRLNESSKLKVHPQKDIYRLGNDIVLSCPDEEELTSDVKRLMCLGVRGWSDNIPDCKKSR